MTSPAFDFDSVSLEWLRAKPGAKWRRTPGALAAWVADMDFAPPAVVVDALQRDATGGDLGYPDWRHITGGSPATDAFVERCARRYGWHIDEADTMELLMTCGRSPAEIGAWCQANDVDAWFTQGGDLAVATSPVL